MRVEPLRTTLLCDGSSDRALHRFIEHLLDAHPIAEERGFTTAWADLSKLPMLPGPKLVARIEAALELEPCDILFVHRDSEGSSREHRLHEIREATPETFPSSALVPIVPVRMTEAWLLIDERAIREAAGNPTGTIPLNLPRIRRLESLPDPKKVLEDALLRASEKSGRKAHQIRRTLGQRKHRVAELMDDLDPLDDLPAFREFRQATQEALDQIHPPSRTRTP